MTIDFIIKREFFNEILSGKKKEEYRDCTDRLINKICVLDENGNASDIKKIDSIRFFEGYVKGRREMLVECLDVEVDTYEDTDEDYFVFILGKIFSHN
jgi:hypothetical protein